MDRFIRSDQHRSSSMIGPSRPELVASELPTVDFSPAEIVRYRTAHWRGVQANTVQIISHEPFEYSFRQEYHLLIAVEQGVRYDGETFVEGLPTSTMRNYSNKLILVPAGRKFFGAQNPRLLTRSICLYIDPRMVVVDPNLRFDETESAPRFVGLQGRPRRITASASNSTNAQARRAHVASGAVASGIYLVSHSAITPPT
jgi:hypothetical protein